MSDTQVQIPMNLAAALMANTDCAAACSTDVEAKKLYARDRAQLIEAMRTAENTRATEGNGDVEAWIDSNIAGTISTLEGDRQYVRVDALRAFLSSLLSKQVPDTLQALESVWQQARQNHVDWSATGDRESDLRFFALGMCGEAGEVANFVKKRWRDGDGHDKALRYEVADVCAYAFMLADTLGMTATDLISTIAEKQEIFIAKMKAKRAVQSAQPQSAPTQAEPTAMQRRYGINMPTQAEGKCVCYCRLTNGAPCNEFIPSASPKDGCKSCWHLSACHQETP